MSFLDGEVLPVEGLNVSSSFVLDPEDEDGELFVPLPKIQVGSSEVETAYVSVDLKEKDFLLDIYINVNESA